MANPMASEEAELASLVATLDEVRARLAAMAQRLAAASPPREDVVAALFEAERSVLGSVRSVTKARRQTG